jgi:hypothetical protein
VRGIGPRSFGFELALPTGSRHSALRLARRLYDALDALGHQHDSDPPGPPDNAA